MFELTSHMLAHGKAKSLGAFAALCSGFWLLLLWVPQAAAQTEHTSASQGVRSLAAVTPALDEREVYADMVAPLLEQRCQSCHGASEQEAGLRLDRYAELAFGSELGPVLVPGAPEASALIQVLLLPTEHERHMPPRRKTQLQPAEIELLTWWVEAGAPEAGSARELGLPNSLAAAFDRAQELTGQSQPKQAEATQQAEAEVEVDLSQLPAYAEEVQPLLKRYCFECHGATKQKGEVRLDDLDPDIVFGPDAEHWHAALDMINGAEMPPRKADQPSDAERRLLVQWMTGSLNLAAERRKGEIQSVMRRLNKQQYTHTLQELLDLSMDLGRALPDDAKSESGFSNNGEVLQASPLHLETYQQIARKALNQAIVEGDRPAVTRYRISFGKGIGRGTVAGMIGGYQALPISTEDFLLEILDERGQVIVPETEAEVAHWNEVRRKIGIGLRGSSRSRFQITDQGMVLYGALPHREVAPGSWQGPSPNVKVEMQRVFPDEGDFLMTVQASRGYLFSSKEAILIEPGQKSGMAFNREGSVVAPAEAMVFEARQASKLTNLELRGNRLHAIAIPEPSTAQFEFELKQPGYFHIDMVHPAADPESMPSARLSIGSLNLDRRFNLSGNQLDAKRLVSAMGAAYLPAGKHQLQVGGRFFVGFEQLILTPVAADHPTVGPLQRASAEREAELARKVPSLRAFVGTRTDDGMDYANFDAPQEVHAPLGHAQPHTFRGRLENLPIPEPESGDTEILSGFTLIGIWNDHLVKSSRDPGPPVLVESIELEAPYFEQWPPSSHQQIFFASAARTDEEVYAEEVIHRFMERAFRRPVQLTEVERYADFWQSIRPDYDSFEASIREVLVAVLCSPNFLYLAEPEREVDAAPTTFALANRLSYFLSNSQPDEPLWQAAREGSLPERLESEVDRLLDDASSERFVRAFTREWLRLDRHELVTIDVDRFPAYTRFVKRDMAEETMQFMLHLLREDLSLFTMIDSDFAMLNQNLAEFYGIPGVAGQHFRPVSLPEGSPRGGLLGQGAFLAGHSDGAQPHPIKRAVWLKEKILGDEPPPPPPNVPQLDPEAPGFERLTLKEQLEKHRDNPSCHDCHAGIDPYGIVFESLNAVGMAEKERNGKPIDTSTVLPDGTAIADLAELKQHLLQAEKDAFARAFIEHLMAYALGRDLSFADEEEVSQILEFVRSRNYSARAVIHGIVRGPSFSTR